VLGWFNEQQDCWQEDCCIAVALRKQQANIIVHCSAIEQEAEHVMSCGTRSRLS